MVMRISRILLSLGLIFTSAITSFSDAGDLDTTFNPTGCIPGTVVTTFNTQHWAFANGVIVQSDRKVIVVGSAQDVERDSAFALTRYNENGSLDVSFDSDGLVMTDMGSVFDAIQDVVLQSDDKIVVVGSASQPALARYNSDGSLDATFGTGGKVVTEFSIRGGHGQALALQGDGKIVIAGYTEVDGSGLGTDVLVARYNTDGLLDTTFGNNGFVTTDLSGRDDEANDIAIQSDGKIVVVGSASMAFGENQCDIAVLRYQDDGSLDAGFGVGGKTLIDWGGDEYGHCVAIQSDGKILAGGWPYGVNNNETRLARLTAGGVLDSSFGSNGQLTTVGGSAESIALQADGKIVVGGYAYSLYGFYLARYNMDGSLDTSFHSNGQIMVFLHAMGKAVALTPDDKIVIAGTQQVPGYSFAVARHYGTDVVRPFPAAPMLHTTRDMMITPTRLFIDDMSGFDLRPLYPGIEPANIVSSYTTPVGDIRCESGRFLYKPKRGFSGYDAFTYTDLNGSVGILSIYVKKVVVWHDFDGDSVSDFVSYWPERGIWIIRQSSNKQLRFVQWGNAWTIPVPADFDGDCLVDIAVYNTRTGGWFVKKSSDNKLLFENWGYPGVKPVPADYDEDGKADFAVYYKPANRWYIKRSGDGTLLGGGPIQFGEIGCIPVVNDLHGCSFPVLYNQDTGVWYMYRWWDDTRSTNYFGVPESLARPGYYSYHDLSLAYYSSKHHLWQFSLIVDGRYSQGNPIIDFGHPSVISLPSADYTGDGFSDLVLYYPPLAIWIIREDLYGGNKAIQFGRSFTDPVEW